MKLKSTVSFNPLNIDDTQAYIDSFKKPIPKHLGIKLDVTWPKDNPHSTHFSQMVTAGLISSVVQLIESPVFIASDLSPLGVEGCQVLGHGSWTLESIWKRYPHTLAKWHGHNYAAMIGFYDAEVGFNEDQMFGFGVAMIALQECITLCGSTDPSLHQPLLLDRKSVRQHGLFVGFLYKTDCGVWREPLLPVWRDLMNRSLKYLEAVPNGGVLANY